MSHINPVVWAEVPVTDLPAAMRFYETVLGVKLQLSEDGPNPMATIPSSSPDGGLSGHLYPGKPAMRGTGPTIHFATADLEAALARVAPAGGEVVSTIIAIPQGRFAYCLDLDGNSIGLFAS